MIHSADHRDDDNMSFYYDAVESQTSHVHTSAAAKRIRRKPVPALYSQDARSVLDRALPALPQLPRAAISRKPVPSLDAQPTHYQRARHVAARTPVLGRKPAPPRLQGLSVSKSLFADCAPEPKSGWFGKFGPSKEPKFQYSSRGFNSADVGYKPLKSAKKSWAARAFGRK